MPVATAAAAPALPAAASTAVAPAPSAHPAAPVGARPAAPQPPTPAAELAADQAALAQLANQAAAVSNDERLAAMGERAAAIQADAQALAAQPAAQVAALNAQLAKILPRGRRAPTPAQRTKAAPLLAQRAVAQGQVAAAEQVADAAQATYSQIAQRRREGFSALVLTRTASPLSPDFWSSLAGAMGADVVRLETMAAEAAATAAAAREPRAIVALIAALVAAIALAFPIRRRLERVVPRAPPEPRKGLARTGLARTGPALWTAIVRILAPTLAVMLVRLVAQWAGALSPAADQLAGAAVRATAWGFGVNALGSVLAAGADPALRLLDLSDEDARRVRGPLLIVAVITGAGLLVTRIGYVIGASVAATIATNCALALAYSAAAVLLLVSFGSGRGVVAGEAAATDPDGRRASVWTLISLTLTAGIAVTLGAVLGGYSTLAALTSGQIFWLSLVAAAAYVVMRFVDDLMAAVFRPRGAAARTLFLLFRFRRSTIAQAGALIGAALQMLVLIGAVSLALTPFGRSGELLIAHLADLGSPVQIGSVSLSLTSIGAGIVTFVVGMGLARMAQRWVVRRYLPVTDWDSGVRNSVATGVGYLGVALALAWALAASGLGFTQVALIASALSVGVGFGLQTIVQNFVSGVILLVERPVKVGDWVSVGGIEGDVRRIRVRATDIVTQDRTTVIVPNSDLITKQVANKTVGERYARVDIRFSVKAADDVQRARDVILGVVSRRDCPLGAPKPEIFVDSLSAAGAVNLTCFFYVEEPRVAYAARSDTYLEILQAMQENKLAFAGPA